METARMRLPVRHNFVPGDILVSFLDPGRCVHVYVDEVLSDHSARIRSINDAGDVSESSRVLKGGAILKYVRDPLLTRLFREANEAKGGANA